MKFNKKLLGIPVIGVAGVIILAGCGNYGGSSSSTANQQEQRAQGQDSRNLINNEPVPVYKFSQIRQTLIWVRDIEANGENTTSFFFNLGNRDPIQTCPSIGMPVPTTAQLTNPEQILPDPNNTYQTNNPGSVTVPQQDPTGIYTGDSSGTDVLCVNSHGQKYLNYWEGYVQTVTEPATWDYGTHTIRPLGSPVPLRDVRTRTRK